MDLSVICVNWNSLDYLRECVASIYEHTQGISFEIIIVDNASPEGDVDTLRRQFPNLIIIRSRENLGFAGANNVGFKRSCGTHVLFLNPDTKLIGPAIATMLESIAVLPDAGIVGCKLLNSDLSVSTSSIQRFPTILNQILNIEALRLRWPGCRLWDLGPLFSENMRPVRVEVIPGACMLLRREVFSQAGMFSEDYFMYAEDLDLNFKVKNLGLANYYVGWAEIIHHGGKSSSRQRVSQWATMMKYRAMSRLFQKTRGRMYGAMYRIAMGSTAAGRLVLLAIMLPFGDRESVRSASEKWAAVVKWALGLQTPLLPEK
jgi:N-acetylglucosaminyl-diphospho-decaprenol L-rhamnosyltransferase